MVKTHQQALSRLTLLKPMLADSHLADIVGDAIPIMRQHLQLAQSLKAQTTAHR